MRRTAAILLAVLAMSAGSAGAQSQGWAITPFAGFIAPLGNMVEYADPAGPEFLQVEPTGGVMVGVVGELGLSKLLAVSGFLSSTVGLTQKATQHFRCTAASCGTAVVSDFQYGMATTQLGATLVIRPMGRLPNGAPKVFYLEAGGGLNMVQFSDVQDRSGGSEPAPSWNGSWPMLILGGGLTFRIGPRSTAVVFARYNLGMSEYSSDGLDDWNSVPPPDPGQKVNVLLVGVGLRTGR